MRKLVLISAFALLFYSQSTAQNRIATWDTEKITNIKIEFKTNGEIVKSDFFNEKEKIDKILNFLKSVEFKETGEQHVISPINSDDWTTRFIFRGQRDWVLFYDNYATIGKTGFWIEKDLNDKVKKLIEELEKG